LTAARSRATLEVVRLVIVHFHLRPGGVRRVIELAAPFLAGNSDAPLEAITLAVGEPPELSWLEEFRKSIPGVPVTLFHDPALGYQAPKPHGETPVSRRLKTAFDRLFHGMRDAVVWCHNPCVGRNLALARELVRAASARSIPLIFHHHDWWFDNRWGRWPEIRQAGFRSFREALDAIFPAAAGIAHATINSEDTIALEACHPGAVEWIPNLAIRPPTVSRTRVAAARQWLHDRIPAPGAPVWLAPCRLLRRKNLAESILLTCWVAPGAWLLTTGGPSSPQEQACARALESAARKHQLPVRLGCLAGIETPTVPELLAACDAVVITSILEGFGLPFLEASAAGRPLFARRLPNIAPDLDRFGFEFPQAYDELWIPPTVFDWQAEAERQARLYQTWKRQLPRPCQSLAAPPRLPTLSRPEPVPFSRLTLSAQLEVLSLPATESWNACAALNPRIAQWRERWASGALEATPWPHDAETRLGGRIYAQRFFSAVARARALTRPLKPMKDAQMRFIASRLDASHQYPLLWFENT
jgi:glycosyltransferase involved in cell wall biosynthesis